MSTRHSFLSTTGLLRSNSSVSVASSYHASTRDTMRGPTTVSSPAPTPTPDPQAPGPNSAKKLATRAGVLPLGSTFIVILAGFFSLLFIVCISFAFMGLEDGSEFKDTLNDLARNSPGIVLVGDNVDVDVDEPAVTVRWSILGCGSDFMLPQSGGIHGSDLCGTPVMALQIFVDGDDEPTATYDPQRMPFASDSGQRRSIQNLYQFDSDHVLDVHEARLYPFDEYHLTSTIRAISIATNQTVPIVRLPTITQTSSFIITPTDMASYVTMNATDGQQQQQSSRDLDLIIRRPGEARAFALLLFAASWMMTHAAMAYIILSFKADATKRIVHYMGFVLAAILLIPQMRNAMPDAPGFDGVLIDNIGFFPQMFLTGVSLIAILAALAKLELQGYYKEEEDKNNTLKEKQEDHKVKEAPAMPADGLRRLRMAGSSVDFRHIRNFSKKFTGGRMV